MKVGTPNGKHDDNGPPKPYIVHVSKRFLFATAFIGILLAYVAGRTARFVTFRVDKGRPGHDDIRILSSAPGAIGGASDGVDLSALPSPRLIDGKIAPHTLYTAKNFDTAASAITSSVHLQQDVNIDANKEENAEVCRDPIADNTEGEDDEEHLPAGQHLLVDIKNVDSAFLNSESRLAHAMVNVVNESKLTLLSYHCHSLVPTGVSCVGVLLESHVSFHTWPEEGVITLDLFTCGSGELVPVLPLIEKAFALPQKVNEEMKEGYTIEPPLIVWSHKLRGFRPTSDNSVWSNDLGRMVVEASHLDLKVEVATTTTKFQRIHIYDTISAISSDLLSYQKSLSNDGSYQSKHAELYLPNRVVFLEGVLQSTRFGNEAYHEALVQPAMFAHQNPKKVGIIGGGEGATLREVLKHKSLEKVKMIEIDEEMVSFSRKYLPDWSDCSDLIGSTDWCGDDKRADLMYEDGAAWFNNRFSDEKIDSDEYKEEPFDVLIMDALDPQDNIPFADLLYTSLPFLTALYNSLEDDGIIVMQLGGAPTISSPPENVALNEKRGILTNTLSKAGFKSIHIYEESHCGFHAPWSFLIGMKSGSNRKRWYRTGADIDIDIHQRILRTHSGSSPIKYFDGATMTSYQLPSKAFESVYCKAEPTPESCKTGDKKSEITSQSVRRSRNNPFDLYLDRHIYEKNTGEIKNLLCDYFYYNEARLKHNKAIDYEELKRNCAE